MRIGEKPTDSAPVATLASARTSEAVTYLGAEEIERRMNAHAGDVQR